MGRKAKEHEDKNVICINKTNPLHSPYYTLGTFEVQRTETRFRGNEQIPHRCRSGSTPGGKARSGEGWILACLAHAYLWCSTSLGDTSQAAHWRAGEL